MNFKESMKGSEGYRKNEWINLKENMNDWICSKCFKNIKKSSIYSIYLVVHQM